MDRFEYMPVDPYPWEIRVRGGRVLDTEGWFHYISKLGAAGWEPVGKVTSRYDGSTDDWPELLMRRRVPDL